jgi:hypothetical protein
LSSRCRKGRRWRRLWRVRDDGTSLRRRNLC